MNRRRYLAVLGGATAGLAGCVDSDDTATTVEPETGADAPTKTPDGTRTPASPESTTLENNEPYRTPEGWTLRVVVYRVRRGIVEWGTVHTDAVVPEDRQFLQAGVRTGGEGAPDPSELCIVAEVDGERPFEGCTSRLEAVSREKLGQLHAVPVPLPTDADSVAVVWHSGDGHEARWRVDGTTVAELDRPPEFVVEDLAVPDSVADGEEFEVDITLRNDGGRKDWFAAELGFASASDAMDLEIPLGVGERVTVPRTLTAHFAEGDEATVVLDWDLDSLSRTVMRA
jgi:hypothetical protein